MGVGAPGSRAALTALSPRGRGSRRIPDGQVLLEFKCEGDEGCAFWVPDDGFAAEQAAAIDHPDQFWDLPEGIRSGHDFDSAVLTKAGGHPSLSAGVDLPHVHAHQILNEVCGECGFGSELDRVFCGLVACESLTQLRDGPRRGVEA